MASPNKVSPSDCDNDWQAEMAMWPPKLEILISLQLWQIWWQFQRQIWGFRIRSARKKNDPGWLRQRPTTGSGDMEVLGAIFGSRLLSQSFGWSLLSSSSSSKSRIRRWNFDAICHSSTDVIISGFGGHIDMAGFRTTDIIRLWSTDVNFTDECWWLRMTKLTRSIDNGNCFRTRQSRLITPKECRPTTHSCGSQDVSRNRKYTYIRILFRPPFPIGG